MKVVPYQNAHNWYDHLSSALNFPEFAMSEMAIPESAPVERHKNRIILDNINQFFFFFFFFFLTV